MTDTKLGTSYFQVSLSELYNIDTVLQLIQNSKVPCLYQLFYCLLASSFANLGDWLVDLFEFGKQQRQLDHWVVKLSLDFVQSFQVTLCEVQKYHKMKLSVVDTIMMLKIGGQFFESVDFKQVWSELWNCSRKRILLILESLYFAFCLSGEMFLVV